MILSRQFRALFRFAGWWSVPWGVGPAAAFAALGAIAGAPAVVYLPLLGLGLASAAVSGGLATATVAAARRGALPPEHDTPHLPAS